MKFELSNAYPGDPKVRLVIEVDRGLAGEILDFAYRLYEEKDRQYIESAFKYLKERNEDHHE